jgi:mannose-6-phosphate isomerase-like protein (cupin superfamily)
LFQDFSNTPREKREANMARTQKLAAAQTAASGSKAVRPITISRDNAEHYRWGHECDGWHLVKDRNLSVIEEFMPPGSAEIRHHHEHAQQFFYILTGEVLMEIEGETTLIRAGSGIRILPGIHHQIRNPSSTAVRFLVVSQPPSHNDRIDD